MGYADRAGVRAPRLRDDAFIAACAAHGPRAGGYTKAEHDRAMDRLLADLGLHLTLAPAPADAARQTLSIDAWATPKPEATRRREETAAPLVLVG